MDLVDSWRLFGPNLQTPGPAVLAEVSFALEEDVERAVLAWRTELARMTKALGVSASGASARTYHGGAVLTFSGTIDVLLPLTDVNEWAVASAVSVLAGTGALPLEPRRSELALALDMKRSPWLLSLEAEAAKRNVAFLWDDERVTLGEGKTCRSWPLADPPRVADAPWAELGSIPVALVTGTNGKTTSVRLLARILEVAGRAVGMTTTDGVFEKGTLVEKGDYTGPAGALRVLRSSEIDAAVLETARGGILRRGLAVRSADVALLTNVSADHLGHYGVDDVETLARVKAVTASVVRPGGRIVVNADDAALLSATSSLRAPRVLFAVHPESAALASHRATGGEAWTVRDGWIVRAVGAAELGVVRVNDVPLTFGGAAPYNVANALGAAASARSLGVTDADIVEGLTAFTSGVDDNPGRGNLVVVRGVRVLVDFAHNPEGIRSVLTLAARLGTPGAALRVVAGYAGDRSDVSVRDAAQAIANARPALVVLRDLQGYLRGRAPGEVPALLRAELERGGVAVDAIDIAPSEGEAVRRAIAASRPGDVVVVLAHLESDAVRAVLAEAGVTPRG